MTEQVCGLTVTTYDLGDDATVADRYTVVLEKCRSHYATQALALSSDCYQPNGFSQWVQVWDNVDRESLGKEIAFTDLPERVQQHVKERLA